MVETGKYIFTKEDIGKQVFHRWTFDLTKSRESQVGVILDVEDGVNGIIFVKFNHKEFRSIMCHRDLILVENIDGSYNHG